MENTNTIETQPAIGDKEKKAIATKIKKRYDWSWYCIGIQMILSQGISMALMLLVVIAEAISGRGMSSDSSALMGSVMVYAIPIAAVAYIISNPLSAFISLKVTKAASFKDYLKKPDMSVPMIILAVFATLGLSNVDSIIMSICESIFSASSEQISDSISIGVFSDNVFLSVLSVSYVCILGPFFEELLCRGAIQTLGSHISPKFGIFVSAFIFGIFHLNISQFFNAFILGLLLGYVTYKSGSIIPSTLMHIANNSLAVITMAIGEKMTEAQFERFEIIATVIITVVGVLSLIAYLIITNKSEKEKAKAYAIVNKPVTEEEVALLEKSDKKLTFGYFLTSPAFYGILAFFIISCVTVQMTGA